MHQAYPGAPGPHRNTQTAFFSQSNCLCESVANYSYLVAKIVPRFLNSIIPILYRCNLFSSVSQLRTLDSIQVKNPRIILRRNFQQLIFYRPGHIQGFNKFGHGFLVDGRVGAGESFQGFEGFGIVFTT